METSIRIRFDGTTKQSAERWGYGWVIESESGRPFLKCWRSFEGLEKSSSFTEWKALYHALVAAAKLYPDCHSLIILGDCHGVIDQLNSKHRCRCPRGKELRQSCWDLLSRRQWQAFTVTRRENRAAHRLSRKGLS